MKRGEATCINPLKQADHKHGQESNAGQGRMPGKAELQAAGCRHSRDSLRMRANPKSQSLMTKCFVIRMFSGFTSLWMHWRPERGHKKGTVKHKPRAFVLVPAGVVDGHHFH